MDIHIAEKEMRANARISFDYIFSCSVYSSFGIRPDNIHTSGGDFPEDHVHHAGARVGERSTLDLAVMPCSVEFRLRFLVLAEPERIA